MLTIRKQLLSLGIFLLSFNFLFAQLTATITDSVDAVCSSTCNGTATVTPTGGTPPYTYLWDDPANQTDSTAVGLCADTFTVMVIDSDTANVDTAYATVIIGIIGPPIIISSVTVDTNVSCFGASTGGATVTITGGTPPYDYSWSSGDTTLDTGLTNSTSTLPSGQNIVTITDSIGCTNTDNVTIVELSSSVLEGIIVTSTNESCNGCNDGAVTALIIGATPPYTYLWDDPSNQTTATAIGLSAGDYSVTVTDSLGCSIVVCGRRIFIGDTLFFEDFQSGVPPCFSIIDNDTLTPNPVNSFVDAAWVIGDNTDEPGDSVAISNSWYSPAGTADDWLISPAIINLDSNTFLVWDAKALNSNLPDGYEVRVSTTGNRIADFDTINPPLYATPAENSTWTTRSINLGEKYANDTIYIAFRNNSTDKFLLLIDDIYVGKPRFEPKLISAKVLSDYYLTPLSQASFTFEGLVENIGSDTLTNVELLLNVNDSTLQDTGLVINSLASSDTAAFANINPFVPAASGTFTVEFWVTADLSANVDSAYNKKTASFIVSDTVYARENFTTTDTVGLGFGPGTSGVMGHTFDLVNPGRLTSVSFKLETPTPGDTVLAEIYNFTTQPGTMITTTGTLIVSSFNAAWYTLNVMGGGVDLDPGKYFIGVREFKTNFVGLAKTEFNFIPGAGWFKADAGSWINIEDSVQGAGFSVTFLIRANIHGSVTGIFDIPISNNEVTIYPNPTRGIINIFYNFEDSKPVTIKVYNVTGKKVGEYNSTSAGIYSIDLSDQANGIYMISIQTRENIITKKFIINKGF